MAHVKFKILISLALFVLLCGLSYAAPTIETVSISPSSPTTSDTLTAYCNATDPSSEYVSYVYSWYIDGVLSSTGNSPGTIVAGSQWLGTQSTYNMDVLAIDATHVVAGYDMGASNDQVRLYEVNTTSGNFTEISTYDTGSTGLAGDFRFGLYNSSYFFSLEQGELNVIEVNSTYGMSVNATYDYDTLTTFSGQAMQEAFLLDNNHLLIAYDTYDSGLSKAVKMITWDDGFTNFATNATVTFDSSAVFSHFDIELLNATTALLFYTSEDTNDPGVLRYMTWDADYSNLALSSPIWNSTSIGINYGQGTRGTHIEMFNATHGLMSMQSGGDDLFRILTFQLDDAYTNLTVLAQYNVSTVNSYYVESEIQLLNNRTAVAYIDDGENSFIERYYFNEDYTSITLLSSDIISSGNGQDFQFPGAEIAGIRDFGVENYEVVIGVDSFYDESYLGLIRFGYPPNVTQNISTQGSLQGNVNYTISCAAYDSFYAASSTVNASVLVAANPVTTATISNPIALDSYDINASCTPATPNIDNYTIHYIWYKDGVATITGNTSPTQYPYNTQVNFTLGSGNTTNGEEWVFSCAAEDSLSTGVYTNATESVFVGDYMHAYDPVVANDNQSQGTPFIIRANITGINTVDTVKFEITYPNSSKVNYTASLEQLQSSVLPTWDTAIIQSSPTSTYSTLTTMYVKTDDANTSIYRGLMRFDTSSTDIDSSWNVLNTTLKFWASFTILPTGLEKIGVYDVLQPANESATWNTYDGTNAWEIAGGDGSGDVGIQFGNFTPSSSAYTGIDLNSYVTWASDQIFLFSLRFTEEVDVPSDAYAYIYSSEGTYPGKIFIDYTADQFVLNFTDSTANGTYTISNIWANDTSGNTITTAKTTAFYSEYVAPTAPTNVTTRSPSNYSSTTKFDSGYNITLECSGSTDANYDTITYVYYADTTDGSTYIGNATSGGVTLELTGDNTWYWKCQPFDGTLYGYNTSVYNIYSNTLPTPESARISPAGNALPEQDLAGYCNASDVTNVTRLYYKWYNGSTETYTGYAAYGAGLLQDWKIDIFDQRGEYLENKFHPTILDDTHVIAYYKGDTYRDSLDFYQAVYPQFNIIEIDGGQGTATMVGEYSHTAYWESFDLDLLSSNTSVVFAGTGSGHDLTLVTIGWEGNGNYTIDTCTHDLSSCNGYGEGPGNGIGNYDGIVYMDSSTPGYNGRNVEIVYQPGDNYVALLSRWDDNGAGLVVVDISTLTSPTEGTSVQLWANTTVDGGWDPDAIEIGNDQALVLYEDDSDYAVLDLLNWSADYTSFTVTNLVNITSSQANNPQMREIDSTHLLVYYRCNGDDACAKIYSHNSTYGDWVEESSITSFATRFYDFVGEVVPDDDAAVFGFEGPDSDGYIAMINWSSDFSTITSKYSETIIEDATGWGGNLNVWPAVIPLGNNKIFEINDDPYERVDAYMWSYDLDGGERLVSTIDSSLTADGDEWILSCAGYDSYAIGSYLNSSATDVSLGPGINSVRTDPTPGSPLYTEYNITGYANGTHALQSTVAYYYRWKINGIVNYTGGPTSYYSINTEQELDTLNYTYTSPGDQIIFEVLGTDGTINSSWSAASTLTISNRLPVGSAVAITPDPASSTNTLTCNWTFTDGDYDATETNSTIEWYVNDGLVETDYYTAGDSRPTLSSSFTSSSDEIRCDVTVSDGLADSATTVNDTITIQNTAPTFTSTNLVPDPSQKSSTLTCSVVGRSDPDGDAMTNYFTFYDSDNTTILQGPSTTSTYGCSADPDCAKGDTITCVAYVSDGTANSASKNDSVSIINTKPVASSVYVNPGTPDGSVDLTCEYTYSDTDGDVEADQFFKWYVNDTFTGNISQTLDKTYLHTGDDWRCEVTVYDGEENSTAKNSSQVTIGGDNPNVILFTTSGEVDAGDSMVFTWTWSDAQLPNGGPYTHYVCNSSNITAAGCADTQLCTVEDNTSSSTCSYTTSDSDASTNTAYVAIVDGSSLVSTAASAAWDVNHYPTASNVTMNVTSAGIYNTYTCSLNGVSDSDSDSTTIYYTFIDYNGTDLQAESTTDNYQINTGSATHGHPVTCQARIYDTRVYSTNYTTTDHFLIEQPTYSSPKYVNQNMIVYVNVSNSSAVSGVNMSIKNPYNSLFTGFEMTLNNVTDLWEYEFAPNIVGTWEIESFYSTQADGQGYIFKGDSDTFTVIVQPNPAAGGGGGGNDVKEIPRISSNITAYCGDLICQEGENPSNCWSDCKVNYDSLITCIWDEDVECNWQQTWFPVFLISFLAITAIVAVYQNEVRRGGGKKKR